MKEEDKVEELLGLRMCECKLVLKDIGTIDQIHILSNLLLSCLRLSCVQGNRETVESIIKKLNLFFLDEIDESFNIKEESLNE